MKFIGLPDNQTAIRVMEDYFNMPPHGEHLLPHEREGNHRREPTHVEIFEKLESIEELLKKLENRL